MIKMAVFDNLQRELKNAQQAVKSLEGTITTLNYDPYDSASVQAAIRQMEAAIDRKTGPDRSSQMVKHLIVDMKEAYRKAILKRSEEARRAAL